MWESPIIRVSTGLLNTVNDTVIGNSSGISGLSKFGGQLGKALWVDSSQIALMFSSTIGTLYAGLYRYVRLKANSALPVRGQTVFWDDAAGIGLYQVTALETITTYVGASKAGIYIGGMGVGNYGFIQVAGIATIKYVASIAGTKAIGRPVSLSQAGTVSIGLADVDDTPTPELFLGYAIDLPADGALGRIDLQLINPRG